jgi:hypothetical protein
MNIYNLDELHSYLERLVKQFPKENVKTWIFSNLKNWFLNTYEKVKLVEEIKKGDLSWVIKGVKEKKSVFFGLKIYVFFKSKPRHIPCSILLVYNRW